MPMLIEIQLETRIRIPIPNILPVTNPSLCPIGIEVHGEASPIRIPIKVQIRMPMRIEIQIDIRIPFRVPSLLPLNNPLLRPIGIEARTAIRITI